MKIKKIISLLLLAGTVLTQVPAVGMDGQDGQQPAQEQNDNDSVTIRNRPRDRQHRENRINPLLSYYMFVAAANLIGGLYAYNKSKSNGDLFGKSVGVVCISAGLFGGFLLYKKYNTGGSSSLDWAPIIQNAKESIKNTAETLRTKKSTIDIQDENGDTLLMRCAKANDFSGVLRCLAAGADINLLNRHVNKNAFKYAIEATSADIVRLLLIACADKQAAQESLQTEIVEHEMEIGAMERFIHEHGNVGSLQRTLDEKKADIAKLKKILELFSQDTAQLVALLSESQKSQYKEMLINREAVCPSLHGSLLLYEYFDYAEALKKYLKHGAQIVHGIATKKNGLQDVMPNVMSFLRKEPTLQEQRLQQALRKAITEKNEELSQLLVKYKVEIDSDEKIALQFN